MCQDCKKSYYITTVIAYASGKPHIDNTYEITPADSIARYKREQGYDVFFQTETDEHGQKIEEKVGAAGVTLKGSVDKTAAKIRGIRDLMNTSYDKFICTTDEDHKAQIQKILKKPYDQGNIYKGYYEGLHCTPCESSFVESQLMDGKCSGCGREVKPAKEEVYFFRMSKYAPRLIEYINEHPEFIQPVPRENEMMNNFLLPRPQGLCVSGTTFSWGIPVSFDPKHVIYVWLDAPANYITGVGYDCDGNSTDQFGKLWPADLHLIGKDIIRFYTIHWPIFLMALNVPLPKQVLGHSQLLQGDGKMSRFKGNVLYADTLVDFFGVDAARYLVLHEAPFDNDGVISWELMVERMNPDLVNILGNLTDRAILMSNKYFDDVIADRGAAESVDEDLKSVVLEEVKKADAKMEQLRMADAMTEISNIFRRYNKYIDEATPWTLVKDEAQKDRLSTVPYNLTESTTIGTSLLYSFTPETSGKILAQLNTGEGELAQMDTFGLYPSGGKVTDKSETLFVRMDMKEVMERVEAIHAADQAAEGAHTKGVDDRGDTRESGDARENVVDVEVKPGIAHGDFAKLQFQVDEIVRYEAVPKSRKLLYSQVKIGSQTRQIIGGIETCYSPEEMVGKKAMMAINLEPAKLAGMLSEGILLCAVDTDGGLALMKPEKDMPAGAGIY